MFFNIYRLVTRFSMVGIGPRFSFFPFTVPGFLSKYILHCPKGSQPSVSSWRVHTFLNPTPLLKRNLESASQLMVMGRSCISWGNSENRLFFFCIPWLKERPSKAKEGKGAQEFNWTLGSGAKLLQFVFLHVMLFSCHLSVFINNYSGLSKVPHTWGQTFLQLK